MLDTLSREQEMTKHCAKIIFLSHDSCLVKRLIRLITAVVNKVRVSQGKCKYLLALASASRPISPSRIYLVITPDSTAACI